uniref:Uncharacterized protein n=1 Tax=Cacopsylla melanoneura TaxID=428564 RepID=A0A8D8WX17_9HEMI
MRHCWYHVKSRGSHVLKIQRVNMRQRNSRRKIRRLRPSLEFNGQDERDVYFSIFSLGQNRVIRQESNLEMNAIGGLNDGYFEIFRIWKLNLVTVCLTIEHPLIGCRSQNMM